MTEPYFIAWGCWGSYCICVHGNACWQLSSCAAKVCTSACRPPTTLLITMQTAPAPPSACVQQPRTFLTNLPKGLLGFERSNIFIFNYFLFQNSFSPPDSSKKFQTWHCLRDNWAAGEIDDLQHSLLSVHERRALCIQLRVLEKDFLCPACSASELWGAERERRGLLASILILHLLRCKTWL